jgi:two-component system CheB/CheR fusion protein
VIAQSPDDAEHEGMPASAIATGKVDIVLPVADIPERLMQLWQNASRIEIPTAPRSTRTRRRRAAHGCRGGAARRHEGAAAAHRAQLQELQARTVLRRIERRMQVNRLPTLGATAASSTSDADEPRRCSPTC